VFELLGRHEESIAASREANRLQPGLASIHNQIGWALKAQGKRAEAIAAFREANRVQPDDAEALRNLGSALADEGKFEEAIAAFREVIRLHPDALNAFNSLGATLCDVKHDYEAAAEIFREGLRFSPGDTRTRSNLGEALAQQGKLDEAILAFREAIRLRPGLGSAHCNLGYCLRRKGQYPEALASFQRVQEVGRQMTATDLQGRGWKPSLQRSLEQSAASSVTLQWVHEVEQMIALAPKLEALVQVRAQPADAAERFTLARMCADREWYAAAARFWADAFTTDPERASDLQAELHYCAARAAALAAAGKTKDTPPSDEAARAKLRQQARDWLLADLAAYAKCLDGKDRQAPGLVLNRVAPWKYDPQLASLRDPDAVAKLPAEEQEACRRLWTEVEAVLQKTQEKPK
jgi:Flp pilus assembly protein TadD